jgi:rSAM/selenodomain-associated transferase 1
MTTTLPVGLVVAKAPVPGEAKTRLAAVVGPRHAAELAAAALLDTIDACERAFGRARCHLALTGDVDRAARAGELRHRLGGWTVHPQRGDGFAERLARAHQDVAGHARAPVVQIGMDTPHVTREHLHAVADHLHRATAVLGPACDGGWWVLGLRSPGPAAALTGVPMSTERTCADTEAALKDAGADVVRTSELRDVDTIEDAAAVAAEAHGSRFAEAWRSVAGPPSVGRRGART